MVKLTYSMEEREEHSVRIKTERLQGVSLRGFNECGLCLAAAREPMTCREGHIMCKACVLEYVVEQKKKIKKAAKARRKAERKAKKGGGIGSLSGSQMEEALAAVETAERVKSASVVGVRDPGVLSVGLPPPDVSVGYWMPHETPEADAAGASSVVVSTQREYVVCPERGRSGKPHKLTFKGMVPLHFAPGFGCAACLLPFRNGSTMSALAACGHVLCRICFPLLAQGGGLCPSCSLQAVADPARVRKGEVIVLSSGGTGYVSNDLTNAVAQTSIYK